MVQRLLSKLFPYNEPSIFGTVLAVRGSVTYKKTPWIRLIKMQLRS